VLLELCQELPADGIVICAPARSELADACRSLGFEVRDFFVPKLRDVGVLAYGRYLVRAISALTSYVVDERITVLHSFLSLTTKVAAPVALLTGVPLVQSVHDITSTDEIGWLKSSTQYLVTRSAQPQRMIAVSHFVRASLISQGYRADRIEVIHNGVAPPLRSPTGLTRTSLGIDPEAVVFLHVGRITEWKGHMVTVKAFDMLRDRVKQRLAHLLIVGRPFGPDDEQFAATLAEAIGQLPATECITMIPHTSAPGDLYTLADVVVVPSVRPDPFPTVVLEAGMTGRPAIVSDQGGGQEAVLPDSTGLVIQPTPYELSLAMERALDDLWRTEAGQLARRHIESKFSRSKYASQVVQVWHEASRARTRGPGLMPRTVKIMRGMAM